MSSADSAKSKDCTQKVSTTPNPIENRAVTGSSTATTAILENPRPNTLVRANKPPISTPQPVVSNTPTVTSVPSGTTSVTTSNKFRKKKSPVSMTTASNSTQASIGPQGENTGRWTAEEHRLFLQGLDQHGKGWKKIASLIKSRTVVQIRTHAQKYFQKLAKARQNGEEGEIPMDTGRVGPVITSTSGIPAVVAHSGARRRQAIGTKRKAIASVVKSATRQGKKMAAAQASAGAPPTVPPLPSVAPALAPFLPPEPPSNPAVPSMATAHGTISGPAFEDSLFRFLTPVPVTCDPPGQVNDVARQVGANPITLPSDNPSTAPSAPGDISPTGVTDYALYPSWNDAKDLPNWYSKGADVDCLLEVADNLDWLADSGDLHETYEPPKSSTSNQEDDGPSGISKTPSIPGLNSFAPGGALPTLLEPATKKAKLSSTDIAGSPDGMEDHLQVFDTMDEHAFVSALLENNGDSSTSLPNLG